MKYLTNLLKIVLILTLLNFLAGCKKDNAVNQFEDNNDNSTAGLQIEDIVIYEVNLRAFSAEGDFHGVIERMQHIKSLGVNVIWLMPIHPIGKVKSVNSPYSVRNYYEVNPEFGTLEDFKQLVETAHDMDMRIIMDWVANHTAWDNPWIENRSWYTQNAAGEIIHPPGTNWQDVADLNYDNDSLRLAMIDAMEYWVETADIDGFRCDAADFVPFDFWRQAIDSLEQIADKKLFYLAEGARNNHFDAGFHVSFSWDFYGALKSVVIDKVDADWLYTTHINAYENIPDGKHKLRFTTNHDESAWDATPVKLFGGQKASLAAFIIAAYLDGVPLIYGSQEVGVEDNIPFFSNQPIDWTQNPDVLNAYQQIMTFYDASAALQSGSIAYFNHSDIFAFQKNAATDTTLIMVNTRNRNINYALPSQIKNSDWTDAFDDTEIPLESELQFQSYQYFLLKNKSAN